jgi:hypothetical protein
MGLVIALLVISLSVHEAAHGWVALQCGDTTARDLGRITLNPLPHLDLFMTIVLPTLCILSKAPVFGGARPVPVNFYNLRRPWRDMALVALAGPLSNFLLAVFFYLCVKLLVDDFRSGAPGGRPAGLWQAFNVNLCWRPSTCCPSRPWTAARDDLLLPSGLREPTPSSSASASCSWSAWSTWCPRPDPGLRDHGPDEAQHRGHGDLRPVVSRAYH